MIKRIRTIEANEQSPAVANLHAAMRAIGVFPDPAEERERRAGPATQQRLRELLRGINVPAREDVFVDDVVAAAINRILTRQGIVLADADSTYWVRGRVTGPGDVPVRGLVVTAFDQDLRTRQELGTASTDSAGEYFIAYEPLQFRRAEKEGADLLVVVRSPQQEVLHETNVVFNAARQITLDVRLASLGKESELARITRELVPLLEEQDVELATLEEDDKHQDIRFAASETGLPAPVLVDFAVAYRLERQTRIDVPFWYAALRMHAIVLTFPPVDAASIERRAAAILERLTATPDVLREALERAVKDNIIDQAFQPRFAAWLDQYQSLLRGNPRHPRRRAVGHALAEGNSDAKKVDRILADLATAPSRAAFLENLKKRQGVAPEEVESIETALSLADVTLGETELVRHLFAEGNGSRAGLRRVAARTKEEWESTLAGANIELPQFIAGATLEDKRRNWAAILEKRFQEAHPTAAFTGRLAGALRREEKTAVGTPVLEFLDAHESFDLSGTNVDRFLSDSAASAAFNQRETLLPQLKAVQRVFRLAPRFEAVNTLLGDGLHSAQKVYRMGRKRFVDTYASREGFDTRSAARTWELAANAYGATLTIIGLLRGMQNANDVAGLATTSSAVNDFPNLANLFGRADVCECEECRSIFSPAAYFADVLQYLGDRPSRTAGVSARKVLYDRRPDLGYIELSCENSHTPLPYVDLVCEVLEDQIAPPVLFSFPAAQVPLLAEGPAAPGVIAAFAPAVVLSASARVSARESLNGWVVRDRNASYRIAQSREVTRLRQTHATADELSAVPEYVNDNAYITLAGARRPLGLPFDLFTEETRAYLEQSGVRRSDLLELLRGTSAPNNATALDVAIEHLGIAAGTESDLIFNADPENQFQYWNFGHNATAIANMAQVDIFLGRTGLEYADLLRLLSLDYVNPGGAIQVHHLDSTCNTSAKRLDAIDKNVLDRVHRFLRLWRKLGWKMWEVDLVIATLNGGQLSTNLALRLRPFLQLKEAFPTLTVEQLLSFFGDLNTRAKFTEAYGRPEPSLYEKLFLNKRLTNPLDPLFAVSAVEAPTPAATIDDHLPPIVAATRATHSDLQIFRALRRPANGALYLTDDRVRLSSLSFLYRHATLARLLRIKAGEWQKLLYLAQRDPFATPADALAFVRFAERVRASGFTIDQLAYILSADLTTRAADPERNVTSTLTTLRNALRTIAAENDPAALPATEEELENVLAARLQTLGWPAASVQNMLDVLHDRVQLRSVAAGVPPFDFPPAITSQMPVAFDAATNSILFGGFMTDAQQNTLLTDPLLGAVSGLAGYQAAINELHAMPRLALKVYLPRFTASLETLPATIQFAQQLPPPLAARIAYDAERRELSFFGVMTAAERTAIEALSADGTYLAATGALFNRPRVGVFPSEELWLSAGQLAFPLSDHVLANLTLAATRLLEYAARTLSRAAVVQQVSAALRVSAAIAEKLLTGYSLLAHPVLEDFNDAAFAATTSAITNSGAYVPKYRVWYWLHRVALTVRTLRISYADLDWLVGHDTDVGVLDFAALPLGFDPTIPAVASIDEFLALGDLMKMHHEQSDEQVSMLRILSRLISDAGYTNVLFAADVEMLTLWPAADVEKLTTAPTGIDVAYPAGYRAVDAWLRLKKIFTLLQRLNASAAVATDLARPDVLPSASAVVKNLVRSRLDEEQWFAVSKAIQDKLRARKRDSLVAYLLTLPAPPDPPTGKWENANDLFAYYLIDVEMASCQPTSRIVQASAAAQLFVQRAFMGLEPKVHVDADTDDGWEQWAWMKRYRVWEANRRVFAYPENYAEPELRRDRSVLFKNLEDALLQKEINRDNVESAFLQYLEGLDEIAQLEVAGSYYQENKNILHVFGRTAGGDPRIYYYRQFVDGRRWTPWSKLDTDIKADYVVPLVANDRLHLVWPELREDPQPPGEMTTPAQNQKVTLDRPQKKVRVHIAVTELRNGKWTPKKVSADAAAEDTYTADAFDASAYAILPLDLTNEPNGRFYLLFTHTARFSSDYRQSLFELAGCRGYPELVRENLRRFDLMLTHFERDDYRLRSMKNVEGPPGDPLTPADSLMLSSTILGLTPDSFRVTYEHTLSFIDRLYNAAVLLYYMKQSARYRERMPLAVGTFRDWFYADKLRTFFVHPGLMTNAGLLGYKEVVALIEPLLPGIDPAHFIELVREVIGTISARDVMRLHFKPFYHPLTCRFMKELYSRGIDGLMARETQFADRGLDFHLTYQPSIVVTRHAPYKHPDETVDFEPDGAYSSYNWELFFHAPMMIAQRLADNQRFDDAIRWFHYIFDPTGGHSTHPVTGAPLTTAQRYWVTKPFFERQGTASENHIQDLLYLLANDPAHPTAPATLAALEAQVADWRENPFDPHLLAQYRIVAYQKMTVMKYVRTLIAAGDQAFRGESLESVNEATQFYVLAEEILGQRPQRVPPAAKPVPLTFAELEEDLDDFSNAIIGVENLIPPLPATGGGGGTAPALPNLLYFCIPQNDELLEIWNTVDDRLYKIRNCLTLEGAPRTTALFAPRIDPRALVKAVAGGADIAAALADLDAPLPYYRFTNTAQKANEFVNDVKALGAALLAALEKKDAEALSLLRQAHELDLLQRVREVKKNQVDDAGLVIAGLEKNRELVETRRQYYASREFMNAGEIAAATLSGVSLALHVTGTVADVLAGAMFLIPDFKIGASGFGGSPHFAVEPPTGQKIGSSVTRGANGLYQLATIMDKSASIASTIAGYQRRQDDWKLQADLATKELEQLERQLASARLRKEIAESELANHDVQVANSRAIDRFMHEKYTNEDLYQWMIGQISQTYFQSYQLALDMARRAERCYRYELGVDDSTFIRSGSWDSLHSGLQAGERLQLDLRRLESSYLDRNRRELELTKSISLATLDPEALLSLKNTGKCFVSVPEELYDLDYPGHYFRRIKTVSISIPSVAGPHTTVACTLRLLRNMVRVSASTSPQYEHNNVDGVMTDDDRFRESHVRVKAIATSTAANDTGMFELNFRDERYLPFEGAGAISGWSIELNEERDLRQFSYETISDVILHIRYTAREDAGQFKTLAVAHLKDVISAAAAGVPLVRMFDLRHDFPTEWHAFLHPVAGTPRELRMPIRKERFPYFAQRRDIEVRGVQLFVRSDSTEALAADLDPVSPTLVSPAGPEMTLTIPGTPPLDPLAFHQGGASSLSIPLDDTLPWVLKLRKAGGTFDVITDAELPEAYLLVEYALQ